MRSEPGRGVAAVLPVIQRTRPPATLRELLRMASPRSRPRGLVALLKVGVPPREKGPGFLLRAALAGMLEAIRQSNAPGGRRDQGRQGMKSPWRDFLAIRTARGGLLTEERERQGQATQAVGCWVAGWTGKREDLDCWPACWLPPDSRPRPASEAHAVAGAGGGKALGPARAGTELLVRGGRDMAGPAPEVLMRLVRK